MLKMRYFVVDAKGAFRKAPQAAVRRLWEGRLDATALGCAVGRELRLVSVVCDGDLLPQRLYLLRVPLHEGRFTEAGRLTLRMFSQPDCVTPNELVEHHTAGWPRDSIRQLAIALDVSVATLNVPVGIGGPLLLAAARGVTPRQALRYLR